MARVQGLLFGLATLVLVGVATWFFFEDWLPPLRSDRLGIDHAIAITLAVTGLVFIVTNLLLAFFAWKYQDGPGAQALYWHDNPRLEWSWTLITAVIMFGFLFNALGLWAQIQQAPPKDAMLVEVTSMQFAWNVRYPGKDGIFGRTDPKLVDPGALNFIGLDKSDPNAADDIVLPQNQLYLAEGVPVRVRIKSNDVIHGFYVPAFNFSRYAQPGVTNVFDLTVEHSGVYRAQCTQLCGLYHSLMFFHVVALPPAQFQSWLSSQQPPTAASGSSASTSTTKAAA
jgi:cytochrome c oxidase subunit 2